MGATRVTNAQITTRMATKDRPVKKRVHPKRASRAGMAGRKWSSKVTQKSDALDLEAGVFTQRSPRRIALSLRRSALASHRRKAKPFRSAMSMPNFHINRGGSGLTAERRRVLNQTNTELRKLFDRDS
jgi:Protein of unknown function (DUF3175)